MSEIDNILLTKINYSTAEVNRSSPNLNTKPTCEDGDINTYQVPKVRGEDATQSISKSQETISTSSMQDNNRSPLINIDNTVDVVNQPEPPPLSNDAVSLSASFKLLSRRESSLENLAEDDNDTHCSAPTPDNSVAHYIQKLEPNDDIDTRKNHDSSSRFRRTMHTLFSCCSAKSRRSTFVAKIDCNIDGNGESGINERRCSNQMLNRRSCGGNGNKDNHVSLNCLRLRKFFDMLDESDSAVKRVQPSHQSLPLVPYRDGDKGDSGSVGGGGGGGGAGGRKGVDNQPQSTENGGANLARPVLLGPLKLADQGKKCFIIDLDETLVHSSFKMVDKADFKVGVDIEGTVHMVYVLKRPHVDIFLQKMGRIFECVLFTASLAKYADPVTDFLDKWRVFRWRLFRESCVFHRGNYVKDLSMLGRPTDQIVILDNSPASYMFHPDSAVQITSWFDDPKDTALLDLIPYFEQLAQAPSVPPFLASVKPPPRATVPISVMLPLPPPPTSSPLLTVSKSMLAPSSSSSSPITSITPMATGTPLTTALSLLPTVRGPSDRLFNPVASVAYDDLRLPFSRQFRARSLSSLLPSGSLTTGATRASRSEGALPRPPSLPLVATTTAPVTGNKSGRLSRSLPFVSLGNGPRIAGSHSAPSLVATAPPRSPPLHSTPSWRSSPDVRPANPRSSIPRSHSID